MLQLTQKLKTGDMRVIEVPVPYLKKGYILVKNHYSLVSAGTEGSTVGAARKSLIGKARSRPAQVKQVLGVLKTQGPVQTYRAVMKKLDAYSPLGYSCVGEIIETEKNSTSFRVGDLVACGGVTASHAEIVSVPENLCVKLPPNTDPKQAAFNTLGSIALQGVRQADPRLGETCAVIGLGLIGQLTCLLLKAAGVRVIGIDIDKQMVEISEKYASDLALERGAEGIESRIMDFSGGIGCDSVIITAATHSTDPVNFAGAIARKRGTIVVVGDVPTGFDREPHFYRKELQLRMSCSYGPGRYDAQYEEKGIDYPPGYVRWTEKRNMQAFQELVASGKIDLGPLVTHTFKLSDAPAAYDMILKKEEPFLGILIEYDRQKRIEKGPVGIGIIRKGRLPETGRTIGFIGAGSYAQSFLLPNIPKDSMIRRKCVMTASGTGSRSAAERFGFESCTGNVNDILDDPDIDTVFIASRHDTHAEYVTRALFQGKNVFVEKPLCLSPEELSKIKKTWESAKNSRGERPNIMVGYNRRYSPFIQEIRKRMPKGPFSILYRVNAGKVPPDSWIQDSDFGGGRIIGEVCHFVDTLMFLTGSRPASLFAVSVPDAHDLNDTLHVCIRFTDGSIGTIAYNSNGGKSLFKEYLELSAHGTSAVIEDFRKMTLFSKNGKKHFNRLAQDKGQRNEIKAFLEESKAIIPFPEIDCVSRVTFNILESIRQNQNILC